MRNYIFRFWELEDFENQFNAFIEKFTTAEIVSVRVSSPLFNNSTAKKEMATAFIVYF